MDPSAARQPEPTGIEGAAAVFSAAAFVNVGLAFVLQAGGWLGEVGAHRFLFLGLELAAAAATAAALALCLGPSRGRASRKAWVSGAAAVGLVIVTAAFVLPGLFGVTAPD